MTFAMPIRCLFTFHILAFIACHCVNATMVFHVKRSVLTIHMSQRMFMFKPPHTITIQYLHRLANIHQRRTVHLHTFFQCPSTFSSVFQFFFRDWRWISPTTMSLCTHVYSMFLTYFVNLVVANVHPPFVHLATCTHTFQFLHSSLFL